MPGWKQHLAIEAHCPLALRHHPLPCSPLRVKFYIGTAPCHLPLISLRAKLSVTSGHPIATYCSILATCYLLLTAPYSPLTTCYSLLHICYWLLATYCSILATGYLLLATYYSGASSSGTKLTKMVERLGAPAMSGSESDRQLRRVAKHVSMPTAAVGCSMYYVACSL